MKKIKEKMSQSRAEFVNSSMKEVIAPEQEMNAAPQPPAAPERQLSERGLVRLLALMLEREITENGKLKRTVDKMKIAQIARLAKTGI